MSNAITGKVSVSQHAISRATEHFRIPRQSAETWIRDNLRKATFVTNIVSDDGRPTRLYAFQRIAFAVAADEDFVMTLYPQNYALTPLKRKIAAILKRELAAAERKERAAERRVRVEKAKLTVELAQCKLRMEVTPSKAVIAKNTALMAQINDRMAALDTELFAAKREKATVAKSLITYM